MFPAGSNIFVKEAYVCNCSLTLRPGLPSKCVLYIINVKQRLSATWHFLYCYNTAGPCSIQWSLGSTPNSSRSDLLILYWRLSPTTLRRKLIFGLEPTKSWPFIKTIQYKTIPVSKYKCNTVIVSVLNKKKENGELIESCIVIEGSAQLLQDWMSSVSHEDVLMLKTLPSY